MIGFGGLPAAPFLMLPPKRRFPEPQPYRRKGAGSMKIFELLSEDRITILETTDKHEALEAICGMLSSADTIQDAGKLREAIFDREDIISTSIGLGIAIPHVRLESVTGMTVAVGVSKEGIHYESFDDKPVHIIIMIAAPEGAHREYLSVLAKIALLLKNQKLRESILDAESPLEVHEALKGH